MKVRKLKERTEYIQESADIIHESYIVGLQLVKIGEMFMAISAHMADLQRKVDNQAEALRGYQNRQKPTDKIVEQLEEKLLTEKDFRAKGCWLDAIEIVKGGAER